MTAEAANTTVTILRGAGTDDFGDPVDLMQPLFTGIPAVLVETGRTIQDPSTPEPRTIRQVTCLVPPWTGVLNTDRVVDDQTGETYMILGVTRPPTLMGRVPVDYLLQLKRVTASGS